MANKNIAESVLMKELPPEVLMASIGSPLG
jgi:hypothetical protein